MGIEALADCDGIESAGIQIHIFSNYAERLYKHSLTSYVEDSRLLEIRMQLASLTRAKKTVIYSSIMLKGVDCENNGDYLSAQHWFFVAEYFKAQFLTHKRMIPNPGLRLVVGNNQQRF